MLFQDLESSFFNLNEEFNNLKVKIGNLMKKYSDLEKQLENETKFKFKCKKCDDQFQDIDKEAQREYIPMNVINAMCYLQVRNN